MAKRIKSKHRKYIRYLKHNKPNVCFWCGKHITDWNNLTADHLTPLSRGGRTVDDNLVLCCHDCNEDKGNMTKREYIKVLNKRKEEKRRADKEAKGSEILRDIFPCLIRG